MSLFLKKGGFIEEKEWKYNKKLKKGSYKFIQITPEIINYKGFREEKLFHVLCETVELEEGFTVRDYFKLFINYSSYKVLDPFINSFLIEFHKCPEEGCIDPDKKIHTITFQKYIELDKYDQENKNYNCEIFTSINGLSDEQSYGIDFWALKNYLDIPIKLLNGEYLKNTRIKKEDNTSEFKCITEELNVNYTLFEFLTSLIYEISFYGTPEQRDLKSKDLEETVEKIKSGELKTYPLDLEKDFEKE